jgi:hypothetical protein
MLATALKSRTVRFGLLLTIASVAQMLAPFFPPEYVGVAGTVTGITVVVLRFVTTLPLDQK